MCFAIKTSLSLASLGVHFFNTQVKLDFWPWEQSSPAEAIHYVLWKRKTWPWSSPHFTGSVSSIHFQQVPETILARNCQVSQLAGRKEAAYACLPVRPQEEIAGQISTWKFRQVLWVICGYQTSKWRQYSSATKSVSYARFQLTLELLYGLKIWNKPQRGAIPRWPISVVSLSSKWQLIHNSM